MKKQVRKAVIPAGGFGTRFLPQTKAMPKEMLPLVDKPIIQYLVEQLVDAGIKDIIIVTGYSKRAIEDHFDSPNEDLLNNLRCGGPSKAHFIDEIHRISDLANFVYVRQKGPSGLAAPLVSVAPLIDDEPFIYALPDDIAIASPNYFKQMIDYYYDLGGSILPCMRVDKDEDLKLYGIVGGEEISQGVLRLNHIIEKPEPSNAPSRYASILGYLFTPDILDYAKRGVKSVPEGAEFQLQDYVLQPMIAAGKTLYGCEIKNSTRYDTGNKLGYLKTIFDFALLRDDVGPELRDYLRKKLK